MEIIGEIQKNQKEKIIKRVIRRFLKCIRGWLMSNMDKLKSVKTDAKQDIDRFSNDTLSSGTSQNGNAKDIRKLEKKIKDITKVIKDPDVWSVNIASRDRMDEVEEKLDGLISRISGVSYIMKNLINNRKLTHEDVQTHLDRDSHDNDTSGSSV